MAEAVHLRLERFIPEVEELSREKLFSQEEIRAIVSNRRRHEYKIERKKPIKSDFLSYIAYEMNLNKLIHKRMSRKTSSNKRNTPKACYSISGRINYLYQRLLGKFKADEDLWIQYLNWCKDNKHTRMLGKGFLQALELHPKNVDLWIMAAAWEFEFNSSPSASRALFQKGLRFNGCSKALWIEYFKMEVLFSRKIAKQNCSVEVSKNENENLEVPEIVFKSAMTRIPDDPEFAIDFMNTAISSKLKSTKLIDHISQHLKDNFPNDPKVVSAVLAARLRNSSSESPQYISILKDTVMNFCKELNLRPSAELAKYYFDFLLDCANNVTEENLAKYIHRQIVKHCTFVSQKEICTTSVALGSKRFLEPKLYGLLIEAALKRDESNVELWLETLNIAEREGDSNFVEALFGRAFNTLSSKSDLKRIWVDYFSWKKRNLPSEEQHLNTSDSISSTSSSSDSEDEADDIHDDKHCSSQAFTYAHGKFLEFMKGYHFSGVNIDDVIEVYVEFCNQIFGAGALDYVYGDLIRRFKILEAKFYEVYARLTLNAIPTTPYMLGKARKVWLSAISFLESSSLIDYDNAVLIWIGLVSFELVEAKSKTSSLEMLSRARRNLLASPKHLSEFEGLYQKLLKQVG